MTASCLLFYLLFEYQLVVLELENLLKTRIKLSNLELNVSIGEYHSDGAYRHRHFLDLECEVEQRLVNIERDSMDLVFDYDPLVRSIKNISDGKTYNTQEKLVTLLLKACAECPEISSVRLFLSKSPTLNGSGALGIEAVLDESDLSFFRRTDNA